MLNIDDYFKKYLSTHANEFEKSYQENALKLLKKVNLFLAAVNFPNPIISSGWRPPSVNEDIKHAAKKSLHMTGRAVDIADPKKLLKKKIMANPDLLKVHGLWMENPLFTPTWVHLDIGERTPREVNIFKP